MNVKNCHSNPQSCDKVDYEVYEEGEGSYGLRTIYTVQVLKIRSALYPRDVGDFKCVASNEVSPDAELIVSLDVQGIYYKLGNIIPLYFCNQLFTYTCIIFKLFTNDFLRTNTESHSSLYCTTCEVIKF